MSNLLSRKKVLGGLVAAGVLTVGLAAPAVAFAQDGEPGTPPASPSAEAGKPDPGQRGAEQRGKLAEQLATELGVPQEKVEAALAKIKEQHRDAAPKGKPDEKSKADREAALKTRLDKAVSDGKLTQEQADAVLAAVEAGVLPTWGGGPGHGGWGGPKHGGWGGPKHGGQAEAPTDR